MRGKIFTTMSIIPGNGAKYFTTNLATYVARTNKEAKVLLIDFDFDNPYLAYEFVKHDKLHGVDNVVNTIKTDKINHSLFNENVISSDIGVDIIKGTTFDNKREMFTKQVINKILKYATELYDFIFIVTTNKPTDAGFVYTLLQTDEVFLIGRNNYSNMLEAPKILNNIMSYYKEDKPIMLVHNYKNHEANAELNRILEEDVIRVVTVLEYDEKTIDNVDLSSKPSFFSKPKNHSSFKRIAKKIVENNPIDSIKGLDSELEKNKNLELDKEE